MSDKPVSAQDKFMLRMPDGMRDSIAERAKANGRSMNSEIIELITDSMRVPGTSLQEIEKALGVLSPEKIAQLSDESTDEVERVLLETAEGLTKLLSTQNGYLNTVMGILIAINKKRNT